jgi:hypothetical protein
VTRPLAGSDTVRAMIGPHAAALVQAQTFGHALLRLPTGGGQVLSRRELDPLALAVGQQPSR